MGELLTDKIPSEVKDKVTQLSSFKKDYKMKLLGKTRKLDGSWKQTGVAIASNDFIELSSALIDPYSNECNLISAKDRDMFLIQYNITFHTFNALLAKSPMDKATHYDAITDAFRNACLNIGDIIIDAKGEIFSVIKNSNETGGGDEY